MRLWPQRLRGQLVLLILAALIVAQGLSLWVFVGERGLAVRAAQGQEVAGRAANVARLLEEAPAALHASILRAADSPLVRFSRNAEPLVGRRDPGGGDAIAGQIRALLDAPDTREIRVALQEMAMEDMHRRLRDGEDDGDDDHPRRRWRRHGPPMMEMQLSIGLAGGDWLNVATRFHRPPLQWHGLAALSFVLSAGVILSAALWFLLTRLTRPLRNLAAAAERIGRGEETGEIVPAGPSELRELAGTFNRMRERLSRLIAERTRLLAALGHDLRSPLTALRVRAELVGEEETRERLIATIEEMSAMVEATLAYARGVAEAEPYQSVDLAGLLGTLAGELSETGGTVRLLAGPDLTLRLRPGAMRRALRNLIENAIRYGGGAALGVSEADGLARIEITDTGPGIPEAELERVFEPFVRLETSRSRETGGSGLGLAIARSIILAHGGEIALTNRPGGGLAVAVTLPLQPSGPSGGTGPAGPAT